MVIKIKHRKQNENLIYALLLGPFLMAPLIQFLKLPEFIKYILDLIWLLLLATMVFKKTRRIDQGARLLRRWVIVFFVITVINYLVNFQSPLYYLWGFRNNFRGYVLFFAVIYYFNEKRVYEALKLLDKLFYINVVIMLFQFLVLGYEQDNLGGIFGVQSGCNGYTNLFFCIMLAIYYVEYTDKNIPLSKFVINIILMLILSAMAELKFFYVEFIILLAVGTLVTGFSWKKIWIILASFIALYIGYHVFLTVFPDIELSFSSLAAYGSDTRGYTSSGDLNRVGSFARINSIFLKTIFSRLFGLGLGNCDYATGVSAVTTPFANKYSWLHYGWMSTSFMYLENGIVGIVAFFGFFILIFIFSLIRAYKGKSNKNFCLIAAICAIAAILNGFYNISLRIESEYMMYFILAIPWCSAPNSFQKNY